MEQHIHGPNPPAPACLPPSPSQTTLEEEGLPWLSPYFWSAILSFVSSGIVPGSPLPSASLFFGDFLESLNSDPAVCSLPPGGLRLRPLFAFLQALARLSASAEAATARATAIPSVARGVVSRCLTPELVLFTALHGAG